MSERSRRDRGAVLAEAALILPILLLLVMGLIEYSSIELQDSQATSAARDGARAGLFDYAQADVVGSAANDAIVAAVASRLDGDRAPRVDVRCLEAAGSTIACSSALPDFDLIEVAVEWDYSSVTAIGFGVPSTVSGTTRMALVGEQATTTTTSTTSTTSTSTTSTSTTSTTQPSSCSVTSTVLADWGGNGGGAQTNGNQAGELKKDLTISGISLSNPSTCGTPSLRIWPGAGPPSTATIEVQLTQPGGTWEVTFPAGVNQGWTNGTKTFQILDGSGAVIDTYTFTMP